jgi:hypothetical protein
VKKLLALPILVALLISSLFLPTGDRLEFFDVDDLVYTMDGFSIDLDPPPVYADVLITGMELADELGWLVPGGDRTVQFGNGMIIVRGTEVQLLAVRTAIAGRRRRNQACQAIVVGIYHLKTTLPKKLFGMITR